MSCVVRDAMLRASAMYDFFPSVVVRGIYFEYKAMKDFFPSVVCVDTHLSLL